MDKSKIAFRFSYNWLPYIVLFAGSFIYLYFYGSYIFFYQEKSSLFIFSADFFKETVHQPGGFLIWTGKLLSSFYHSAFIGSVIVSAIIILCAFFISDILYAITNFRILSFPFILAAALFFMQADYHYLLFNSLGILFDLILFRLVLMLPVSVRSWITAVMAPFLFFLAGSFTWIFLLLISAYFIFYGNKKSLAGVAVMWLTVVLTFIIFREFVFFQTGKTLAVFPYSEKYTGVQQIIFLPVCILIALIPAIGKIIPKIVKENSLNDFYRHIITSSVIAVFILTTGFLRYDSKTREYFDVERLFFENRYDDVVRYNISHPTKNSLTIFLNNISLCETGRLNDMLFHFPQKADGKTLFLNWNMENEVLNLGGYFYYETGMINEAHRWAFENMVMKGLTPEGIKMLIRTDLINGNFKVAAEYIHKLKKTLFYRKDAEAFGKLLADSTLSGDRVLAEKRRTRIRNDFFTITENPYINLEMMLAKDSTNRQAFEYRIAFMLLNKNYKGLIHELPRFASYGYSKLPVHLEEAAYAISIVNKGTFPDIGNIKISNETGQQWNQYLSALKLYKNDIRAAEPTLRRRFGNTFWYWVFYK